MPEIAIESVPAGTHAMPCSYACTRAQTIIPLISTIWQESGDGDDDDDDDADGGGGGGGGS